MTTTPKYDALVEAKREAIRMHKATKLTESECAQEVKDITGGVFITPVPIIEVPKNDLEVWQIEQAMKAGSAEPKRRGWPKGKKRGPRKPKAE